MTVVGIGGLFFRARDPEALANWYREHLNVGPGCAAPDTGESDEGSWLTQGGPVVFAPFKADTDYFSGDKAYMLNLRVANIAQLIEQLLGCGNRGRNARRMEPSGLRPLRPHRGPGRKPDRTVGAAEPADRELMPRP